MFEERTGRDAANFAMIAFRLGIVITFVVMVARMFQLQVVQNEQYETLANRNRLLRIETAATARRHLRQQRHDSGAQPPQL
jgi:cell division protein FtsI/penicillin-binding protein 2